MIFFHVSVQKKKMKTTFFVVCILSKTLLSLRRNRRRIAERPCMRSGGAAVHRPINSLSGLINARLIIAAARVEYRRAATSGTCVATEGEKRPRRLTAHGDFSLVYLFFQIAFRPCGGKSFFFFFTFLCLCFGT